MRAESERVDTASRILDAAEQLVQMRGFNAFSYADAARELHITPAALHYHYASKAELGVALMERYTERFVRALTEITRRGLDAPSELRAYAELYLEVLRRHQMCLCGMLAADYETLPPSMQQAVVHFFDENERWLATVLSRGRAEQSLRFGGSPEDVARMVVASLEGAMLVARPFNDLGRFQCTVDQLLDGLQQPSSGGSRLG